MKKILFFFLFLTLFHNILFANQNKPEQSFSGCNNEIDKDYFTNDNIKIDKLEIDINNYKKWTVNNIKIITNRSRFIPNELKVNFKGEIKISYSDGSICFLKARVRHSGDAKDHIAFKGNSVIQSLDVRLLDGNILGITRFKLFKPDVRGNLDDVVLISQVLRNFGYLAPRSIKVLARVNQTESIMLFQEKASKELLEFNKRREGPILEGDQKFFFETVKDIPDNQLSNWSVGIPFLRNQTSKVMLSKLTNANLINKGETHKQISLDALNNLNLIYLYWSNRFQDDKNDYFFFDYDLDNTLLAFSDEKKIIKLESYNLFLQATNSHHALSATNRKFYWNSIENFYEPILYDANPGIDLDFSTTTTELTRLPISTYYKDSFKNLKENLQKINTKTLNNQLKMSGLNLNKKQIDIKIDKILSNLKNIENSYIKKLKKEIISHNNFKPVENILSNFNKNLREIHPNAYLIQHDNQDKLFKCKIYLEDCEFYNIMDSDLVNLLEGELQINNIHYQYIGKNIDIKNLKLNEKYNFKKFSGSTIFFEDGINILFDKENNILRVIQNKIGSRAYIINSNLENISINFEGTDITKSNYDTVNNPPPKYPIDKKGLTGCLSFINTNFKNVELNSTHSNCEDAINLINTSGNINSINIKNSFSDAFDADFSKLKIENLKISTARNDCTDFSAGNYELVNLELKSCGDKAVSIGEKSKVIIKNIEVDLAEIGLAVKDSSIMSLNNANLTNLKTCVAAYKKKQEFNGGFVELNNFNCGNFQKMFEKDKLSKIILNDKVQNN